ncbi:WXG100 family type VII secretion target [Gordonia sp. DT218]|uniref:WXG100 family type VII secretion target n=1 Tax=Gordonia sp. DT218 TaxID=3416659 RepID=UPI003CEA4E58
MVDLAELDRIVTLMRDFGKDAESLCRNVEKSVANLHVSWTGKAADAHKQAHDRWVEGTREMRSALTDLDGTGRTAHANYSAAVAANKGMWP